MKISYNWLKQHLPLDLKAEDLSAHLLSLGFEVASRERRGPTFTGVVVGKVLTKDKHPNADKLVRPSRCICSRAERTRTFVPVRSWTRPRSRRARAARARA